MLNSIIKDFFNTNTRLVVPNFGTFIKKTDTSEIIFTEILKKDDGVLVSLVMQQYSLERIMAVEMVNKYVKTIKHQTLVDGSYVITDFGEIQLKDNGTFLFVPEGWAYNDILDVKPLEVIKDIEELAFPENLTQADDQTIEQVDEPRVESKKKDTVLIIAVVAALIAILAMGYGLMFSTPDDVDLTPEIKVEQPQVSE